MNDRKKKYVLILSLLGLIFLFFFVTIFKSYSESSRAFFGDPIIANMPREMKDENDYFTEQYSYWTNLTAGGYPMPIGFLVYYFADTPNEIIVQLHIPTRTLTGLQEISGNYSFSNHLLQNFNSSVYWLNEYQAYSPPILFVMELNPNQDPSTPIDFAITLEFNVNESSSIYKPLKSYYTHIYFNASPEKKDTLINLKKFWEINNAIPWGISLFDLFTLLVLSLSLIIAIKNYNNRKNNALKNSIDKKTNNNFQNSQKVKDPIRFLNIIYIYSIVNLFIGFLPLNLINNALIAILGGINTIVAVWLLFTGSHLRYKVLFFSIVLFGLPVYGLSYLTFKLGYLPAYNFVYYLTFGDIGTIFHMFIPCLLTIAPPIYLMVTGIGRFTSVIDLEKSMVSNPKLHSLREIIILILIIVFFFVIFIPWLVLLLIRFVNQSSAMMRVGVPFLIQIKDQFLGTGNIVAMILVAYVFYKIIKSNEEKLLDNNSQIDDKIIHRHRTYLHFYIALFLLIATFSYLVKLEQGLTILVESYFMNDANYDLIYNMNHIFGIADVSINSYYMHLLPEQFNYYGITFYSDIYVYFLVIYFIILMTGMKRYIEYHKSLKG